MELVKDRPELVEKCLAVCKHKKAVQRGVMVPGGARGIKDLGKPTLMAVLAAMKLDEGEIQQHAREEL
eukprot:2945979-Lingulodinium_polyedra.AAC.1